jgi:hypothetical protein
MIKHIVFWRLKPELSAADRDAALQRIKQGFEALRGTVPGLQHLEVGFDYGRGPEASDIVLYTEFDSREALAGYETHPGHQALVPMVRAVRTEKRVVDYER